MKSNLSLSYFEYHDLSHYRIEMINVKSKICGLITYLILFVIGSKYTGYSNPKVNAPAHFYFLPIYIIFIYVFSNLNFKWSLLEKGFSLMEIMNQTQAKKIKINTSPLKQPKKT
jgi:hypothetical protein